MPDQHPENCHYCQKAYKISVTQHENPLIALEPALPDAGTPIYDELRAKIALEDEFFTITAPFKPTYRPLTTKTPKETSKNG